MNRTRIISLQLVVLALLTLFVFSLDYLSQFIVRTFISDGYIPAYITIILFAMIILFFYLFMRLEILKEQSIFSRINWKMFITVMILSFFFFSTLFIFTFTFIAELLLEYRWTIYVFGSLFLLLIFLSVLATVQVFLSEKNLTRKALDLTLLWSIGVFILVFYFL